MFKNFKERFKQSTIDGKLTLVLACLALVVGVIFVSIYCIGTSLKNIFGRNDTNSVFYYALSTTYGRPITIIFIIIALIALVYVFLKTDKKNFSKSNDDRGVHYMEQGTFGTAEWMSKDKAKEVFEVCDVKQTNTVIYGQFTDNGEQVVGYKKPKYAEFNRNIFILAPSGSGKSYTQVKTNIIQHIKSGNSIAVSDPGGGLYGDLAMFCKNRGVKTHVINLADPTYSECWDMIQEVINPDTERLDGLRLNQFVDCLMSNTGEGEKDFFYTSSANLIKAVIGYTSYWHEEEIIKNYKKLYIKVANIDKFKVSDDEFIRRLNNGLISFKWCRQQILTIAIKNGYNSDEINKIFDQIHKHADLVQPFNIQAVYLNLINADTTINNLRDGVEESENSNKLIKKWHPAATNYRVFISNDTDSVRKSAIQGAQLRFGLFIDPNITYVVSHKGLDLNTFNQEQTALFVITSDKSAETKPIASLLFTFLFKDTQDVFDKYQQLSYGKGLENPCCGSAIILDDFFSLGILGGHPDVFATTMSDARKRNIYITIVVQQYSQIEALYGKNIKDSIQGNCATLIYLGGNDPATLDFISKFAGEATVLDESHSEKSKILSTGAFSPEYKAKASKRDILTQGEARTWKDKVLVIQQGEQPLELRPFPWVQLPEYINGECIKTSVYNDLKPIWERAYEDKLQKATDKNGNVITAGKIEENSINDLNKMIASLSSDSAEIKFDANTGEVIEEIVDEFADTQKGSIKKVEVEEKIDSLRDEDIVEIKERADTIVSNDDETNIDFNKIC